MNRAGTSTWNSLTLSLKVQAGMKASQQTWQQQYGVLLLRYCFHFDGTTVFPGNNIPMI